MSVEQIAASDLTPVAIALGVPLALFVLNAFWDGHSKRTDRRRTRFSEAVAVVVAYTQFPYIIRRRRSDIAAEERARISEELGQVLRDIEYHTAWLRTESTAVGAAYDDLVQIVRSTAGPLMHDAWLEPAADSDADMNIPGINEQLAPLAERQREFLQVCADVLSLWPRWLVRLARLPATLFRRGVAVATHRG